MVVDENNKIRVLGVANRLHNPIDPTSLIPVLTALTLNKFEILIAWIQDESTNVPPLSRVELSNLVFQKKRLFDLTFLGI